MMRRGALCGVTLLLAGCVFGESEIEPRQPGDDTNNVTNNNMTPQDMGPDEGVSEPDLGGPDLGGPDLGEPMCERACEMGEMCCGGECVAAAGDEEHCGGCGIRCDVGETCSDKGYCMCAPGESEQAPATIPLAADASEVLWAPYYDVRGQSGDEGGLSEERATGPTLMLIQRRGANLVTLQVANARGEVLSQPKALTLNLLRPGGGQDEEIVRMEALPAPNGVFLLVQRKISTIQSSLELHVFGRPAQSDALVKASTSVILDDKAVSAFGATVFDDQLVVAYVAFDGFQPSLRLARPTPSGGWLKSDGYNIELTKLPTGNSRLAVELAASEEDEQSAQVGVMWYQHNETSQELRHYLASATARLEAQRVEVREASLNEALNVQTLPGGLGPELMARWPLGVDEGSWQHYGPRYSAQLSSLDLASKGSFVSFASSEQEVLYAPGTIGVLAAAGGATSEQRLVLSWLSAERAQMPGSGVMLGAPRYMIARLLNDAMEQPLSEAELYNKLYAAQISAETVVVAAERPAGAAGPRALALFPIHRGERVCTGSKP